MNAQKTINGVRYLLEDSLFGGTGLMARWPDGFVTFSGPDINEEGYSTGTCEALYEDEPVLVAWAERSRADYLAAHPDAGGCAT